MVSRRTSRAVNLSLAWMLLGLPVPVPAFLGGGEGDVCGKEGVACVEPDANGQPVVFCVPNPLVYCPFEGLTATPIVLRDLSSKALKELLVPDPADSDPKDTILAGIKEAPAYPGDSGRHLVMRAKQDGAAAALVYQRSVAGHFTVSVEASFEGLEGLVDGQSTAFFELREVTAAEGAGAVYRIDARYAAAASGFAVSGSDGAGALGEPGQVSAPGVHLSFAVTEESITLSAQQSYGEGLGYFHAEVVALPLTNWVVAFGVEGLGRKGSFFFDDLTLTVDVAGSGAEAEAGVKALFALQEIENAWTQAGGGYGGTGNPGAAAAALANGQALLGESSALLEAEQEAGRLDPTTQAALAQRSFKKADKIARGGEKLGNKLAAKGSTKTGGLANKCNRARWAATLMNAQMFGYKSKSVDKLYAEITLPTFYQ